MSRHRAHIAMIGTPMISHVLPSLGIIRELVDRGHRVTYANDPAAADLVRSAGAEFVRCDSMLPTAENVWPTDPIATGELFLDEGIQALPRLRSVYGDDPADLYLHDIGAYAARALAESQRRPAVQLSPTYVPWEGFQEEVGVYMKQLPGAAAYVAKFNDWLAQCGASTLDMDDFTGRPRRVLAMIPRGMQPNASRVDTSTVSFVGPCFSPRGEQENWTRPTGADRVLLISLGSAETRQVPFYRECLTAFGDLPGWHVVLGIGKYTDPSELGTLPANFDVRQWVPQLAVLEQADAFITHAGMGGSGEGLYHGVPMVAVPHSAEQQANADQLVALGVAQRVDPASADAAALRAAVTQVASDPQVAVAVAEQRSEAQGAYGAARAADLIEEELS